MANVTESTRVQGQTAIDDPAEDTLAAIRAEVARVEALPAEERAKIGDRASEAFLGDYCTTYIGLALLITVGVSIALLATCLGS